MRRAKFHTMSASNRQNDVPRTKNEETRYWMHDTTQAHNNIYWRKGMFAIGREMHMWGELHSVTCWTMLWYTLEIWRNDCGRQILERELLYWCNVVDYEWFIILVLLGHMPILLLFFPSLYPQKHINIEQLSDCILCFRWRHDSKMITKRICIWAESIEEIVALAFTVPLHKSWMEGGKSGLWRSTKPRSVVCINSPTRFGKLLTMKKAGNDACQKHPHDLAYRQ